MAKSSQDSGIRSPYFCSFSGVFESSGSSATSTCSTGTLTTTGSTFLEGRVRKIRDSLLNPLQYDIPVRSIEAFCTTLICLVHSIQTSVAANFPSTLSLQSYTAVRRLLCMESFEK